VLDPTGDGGVEQVVSSNREKSVVVWEMSGDRPPEKNQPLLKRGGPNQ